jgi:hypothetical protein
MAAPLPRAALRRRPLALALFAAVVLAGCADDSPADDDVPAEADETGQDTNDDDGGPLSEDVVFGAPQDVEVPDAGEALVEFDGHRVVLEIVSCGYHVALDADMHPLVMRFFSQGELDDGRGIRADASRDMGAATQEIETVRVMVERDAGGGFDHDNVDMGIVSHHTRVEERDEALPLVRTDGDGAIWAHQVALGAPEHEDSGHLDTTVTMAANCPDTDESGDDEG